MACHRQPYQVCVCMWVGGWVGACMCVWGACVCVCVCIYVEGEGGMYIYVCVCLNEMTLCVMCVQTIVTVSVLCCVQVTNGIKKHLAWLDLT